MFNRLGPQLAHRYEGTIAHNIETLGRIQNLGNLAAVQRWAVAICADFIMFTHESATASELT